MSQYQPKTGQACGCKRGLERDNCPACEGTGQRVDFAAILARNTLRRDIEIETQRNKTARGESC